MPPKRDASKVAAVGELNDRAPRHLERTGCGLYRLRNVVGVQRLDSTRDHAGPDPRNAQVG